jgi:serine/threonine protein kinase
MHALYGDGQLSLAAYGAPRVSFLEVVRELCIDCAPNPRLWRIDTEGHLSATWIRVGHELAQPPEQGWKIHVSASVWSAEPVLRRTLSVLLAEPVLFKVAASTAILAGLNDGTHGSLSQIGKFVTIYPNDDDQAVRLAVALDEATCGLAGPPVPSDRPLRRRSLVHYRYGGFGGAYIQTPIGEVVLAVRAPDGDLVPDIRSTTYEAPPWAEDPFEAAGVVEPLPTFSRVVAGRFAIAVSLHESPRGAVYLALDVQRPASCVLKQARSGAQPAPDGSDARDRLRHEAAVLASLAPDDRIPEVFGLVEENDDLFLAMEDIPGETLEEIVARVIRHGTLLPGPQILGFGRQLASLLGGIHASGYVYRDLKPTNVIVAPDGQLRMVDFEMARDLREDARQRPGQGSLGLGTRGYMSPQQATGEPPAITDDVYSLGALLFLLATGAEPSRAPHSFALLERSLRQLNPAIDGALADLIERCLDPDPTRRPPTMSAVRRALEDAEAAALSAPAERRLDSSDPVSARESLASDACRTVVRRLADTLCADARPVPHGSGLAWVSPHKTAHGLWSRDLYVGSGGTLLALAEIVDALDEPAHRTVLERGARWLVDAPRPQGTPLAGLYVGEAGVGTALLRAGQTLADDALIAAACARSTWIAGLPFTSPDLMNGTTGRLRFHLLLWDETGAAEHLDHAVAAGDHLLATADEPGAGECCWLIPLGYGDMSGTQPLGYAHGTAGIADALLELYEATADDRYRSAAVRSARWLARQAVPALDDGTGLAWPMTPGGEPMPAYWCHGAVGIGQFFLHAAAHQLLPEATSLWTGAARSAALGTRWAGPTWCHGLSGNIDFLLDAYQATSAVTYLDQARSLGNLLTAFRAEDGEHLRWSSDWPWVYGPDWMVGYAGVALVLLRLSEPDLRPCVLARRGSRRTGDEDSFFGAALNAAYTSQP